MGIDERLKRLEAAKPARRDADELQEQWERFCRAADNDEPPARTEGGPSWAELVRWANEKG